jgi:hypothetical protein
MIFFWQYLLIHFYYKFSIMLIKYNFKPLSCTQTILQIIKFKDIKESIKSEKEHMGLFTKLETNIQMI